MQVAGRLLPARRLHRAATRQFVAQQNSWSLEALILCIEIGESEWLLWVLRVCVPVSGLFILIFIPIWSVIP